MQEYLKTLQEDITKFENTIKNNQSLLQSHKKALQKSIDELKSLSDRLESVKAEKTSLENQRVAKTKQRQDILYNGEDPKAITNEINSIKDELEVKEDEVIAVQKRVNNLNQDISEFNDEIIRLNAENQDLTEKIEGCKYCIKFNMTAKAFLDIYEKRRQVKNITTHIFAPKIDGIIIPFLYFTEDHPPFFHKSKGDSINTAINMSLFNNPIQEQMNIPDKVIEPTKRREPSVSYDYKKQ